MFLNSATLTLINMLSSRRNISYSFLVALFNQKVIVRIYKNQKVLKMSIIYLMHHLLISSPTFSCYVKKLTLDDFLKISSKMAVNSHSSLPKHWWWMWKCKSQFLFPHINKFKVQSAEALVFSIIFGSMKVCKSRPTVPHWHKRIYRVGRRTRFTLELNTEYV